MWPVEARCIEVSGAAAGQDHTPTHERCQYRIPVRAPVRPFSPGLQRRGLQKRVDESPDGEVCKKLTSRYLCWGSGWKHLAGVRLKGPTGPLQVGRHALSGVSPGERGAREILRRLRQPAATTLPRLWHPQPAGEPLLY
jgi:hypothetical protein